MRESQVDNNTAHCVTSFRGKKQKEKKKKDVLPTSFTTWIFYKKIKAFVAF